MIKISKENVSDLEHDIRKSNISIKLSCRYNGMRYDKESIVKHSAGDFS